MNNRIHLRLIERFPQEIDPVVENEVLDFEGEAAPHKAPSNKHRKARLENLTDARRLWAQETIQPAFSACIRQALGDFGWKRDVDPDLADGQTLLFHYPTVFVANSAGYVRAVVKIELGARADDGPHEIKSIQMFRSRSGFSLRNERFWKMPACSTKKPFALPTSREIFVWPSTIATSCICGERARETWPS